MPKCRFEWYAPKLEPPPSTKVTSVKQVCWEELHHRGVHRSITNVTVENRAEPRTDE